jgi:hypothetical protein
MLIERGLVELEARQPRQVSGQIDERARTRRVQDHDDAGTGRIGHSRSSGIISEAWTSSPLRDPP